MIAEIAAPLSYSIFKYLRSRFRAAVIIERSSDTIQFVLTPKSHIRLHLTTRERLPSFLHQLTSRALPRDEYRVLCDFAIQNLCQQPHLHFEQPTVT